MNIRKYISLPVQDQRLYWEALVWLGIYKLGIKALLFKNLSGSLGVYMNESPIELQDEDRSQALKIAQAVNAVSSHTFWQNQCLVCALAAKKMLKRRRIKSTLYLGAGFDEDKQMIAHAWLRCGDLFLIGGEERHSFAVTGKFGDV